MVLNKRQKEAFQFLKYLSDCYLDGRTPVINEVDFNKLGEIGVNINRVCSGQVQPDTFLKEFSNSIGD